MANVLPDALRLREIKYGEKASDSDRIRTAREMLAADRPAEALDLFVIAGDEGGIGEVKQRAVADGRPLLLSLIVRSGREVTAAEWKATAERAEHDSRYREAHQAYSEAADEEGLARLQEKLPSYETYVPDGK